MNRPLCVQERGLILLIGLAVLASGILLISGSWQIGAPVLRAAMPIRLEDVQILIPRFVAPEPVDINRADLTELATLPGIGPALAARIIVYRSEHGPFTSIEELQRVSGIGTQTVRRILEAGSAIAVPP